MAWIRLSDDYTDHPKFDNLSDGAFRLWHQGLAFCRKFQTDGLIPQASLRKLKAFTDKRLTELTTPWQDGKHPLWEAHGGSVQMHAYLKWNLSKEEETGEREEAAKRMRRLRKNRRACSPEQEGERSPDVPGRVGKDVRVLRSSERERERKPTASSKWPIFRGNRLVVFDWMLTTMQGTLGVYAESVEWDTWLDAADKRAMAEPVVAADWWPWLQSELLAYARQQGWAVAIPTQQGKPTLAAKMAAAVANIRAEGA